MSLLFYDDSPVFGGHEVMALLGLEAVLAEFSEPLYFFAAAANAKLCEKVAALAASHPQLRLETLDYHSSKLESLRNLLQVSRSRRLALRFEQLQPSLVVAIQGNIEHSSLALLAARRAAIPVTSYIPVPHSNAAMGARLGAIRDVFAKGLFRLPNSFITISDEMANILRQRGASVPIHIVYNGVDTSRFRPGGGQDARATVARASCPEPSFAPACRQLNLPSDKILLGIIGRIEFRQKQQHLLVQAIASTPALAAACHLVFAGDGPDSGALRSLIDEHRLSATLLPWCDPAPLYQSLAALVIPSRYEGLPLVMLEALASGTAVLASDRDGMKDVLPAEWRFEPNNPIALAATFNRFIQQGRPAPAPVLVARVRDSMSLEAFRRAFAATIVSLIPGAEIGWKAHQS
ncbi:MAG: glycosyltransferase [Verrucomicrobiota bacterium]